MTTLEQRVNDLERRDDAQIDALKESVRKANQSLFRLQASLAAAGLIFVSVTGYNWLNFNGWVAARLETELPKLAEKRVEDEVKTAVANRFDELIKASDIGSSIRKAESELLSAEKFRSIAFSAAERANASADEIDKMFDEKALDTIAKSRAIGWGNNTIVSAKAGGARSIASTEVPKHLQGKLAVVFGGGAHLYLAANSRAVVTFRSNGKDIRETAEYYAPEESGIQLDLSIFRVMPIPKDCTSLDVFVELTGASTFNNSQRGTGIVILPISKG